MVVVIVVADVVILDLIVVTVLVVVGAFGMYVDCKHPRFQSNVASSIAAVVFFQQCFNALLSNTVHLSLQQ